MNKSQQRHRKHLISCKVWRLILAAEFQQHHTTPAPPSFWQVFRTIARLKMIKRMQTLWAILGLAVRLAGQKLSEIKPLADFLAQVMSALQRKCSTWHVKNPILSRLMNTRMIYENSSLMKPSQNASLYKPSSWKSRRSALKASMTLFWLTSCSKR